jgi:uncharacterized membrane protein
MKAMKSRVPKAYHELFDVGVALKLITGIVEGISCALIFFISRAEFTALFSPIIHTSLFSFARPFFHSFSVNGKWFWAIYLFIHSAANIFFSLMLFRNKSWAYPAAASVFGLFDLYQIATFIHHPTFVLGAFTIFDLAVIGLVIHEYRHTKRAASN